MAAFSNNHLIPIRNNVVTLYRRLKVVSTKKLTNDDFLKLFVPSEHHKAFRAVGPLISIAHHQSAYLTWTTGTTLTFNLHTEEIPMPRRMVLQHDAPPELVQSITDWIEQIGSASRDAGRVLAVLDYLNGKCSRSELRFLWPSILPLMTADERYEVLCASARELADVKVPKNLPALPPGLREAMRKTTETVAVMGLIPADVAGKPVQAQVSVQVSDGGDFNEPGIGSFHGVYG